jgi:methyl-accepting chemotaxis protein
MSECLFLQRRYPWLQETAVAEPALVLFEQARAKRELATQARRLAKVAVPPDIAANLQQFACDLDAIAVDFEQQARNAAEVAAKSAELAGRAAKLQRELGNTIAEAINLAGRWRATMKPKPAGDERNLD